jgi:hypothetical protein
MENIFFVPQSEFENFLLCERLLINVTTCQNENVKLFLKILSDLELLRGSWNKKRSCVNFYFLLSTC